MKPLVRALVVFGLAILCAAPALAQDRSRPVAYNVLYGTETERNRRLDVYVPEGAEPPYPVVLAFHGSGTTDKSDIAEFGIPQIAAQAGAAIVPVTYTATDPESAYVDAYCALAWVQANGAEYGLVTTRIVTLGHSYGGLPATMLAVLEDPSGLPLDCPWPAPDVNAVRGAISIAGLLFGSAQGVEEMWPDAPLWPDAELAAALRQTPPEAWMELSMNAEAAALVRLIPMAQIDAGEPPHLLVHGAEDETIPYAHTFDYAGILSRNRTSAVVVIDHYSGHVPPPFAYDGQMIAFLERVFGP
jgi:acetyl esterase/lipase